MVGTTITYYASYAASENAGLIKIILWIDESNFWTIPLLELERYAYLMCALIKRVQAPNGADAMIAGKRIFDAVWLILARGQYWCTNGYDNERLSCC